MVSEEEEEEEENGMAPVAEVEEESGGAGLERVLDAMVEEEAEEEVMVEEPIEDPPPPTPPAREEDPATAELREWLSESARLKRSKVDWLLPALEQCGISDVNSLKRKYKTLSTWLPPPAYQAISKAVASGPNGSKPQQAANKPQTPHGLLCVFVWAERRVEVVMPYEELKAFGSANALVKELARRGNALLGGGGGVVMKPSGMRVEYKVSDLGGMKRRVMLTPSTAVSEVSKALSVIVTPH